uniref:glycine, glutamate and proline-rich protein-like n=1 Tax=Arvicanthis niloticus TaxID=61156 RepID=UPI001486E940|nr:glycine, glutamate and proline-rich protein-like [Arvicanthis niloticus]
MGCALRAARAGIFPGFVLQGGESRAGGGRGMEWGGEREKKRNRGKEGTPAAAGWAEGEAEAKLGSDDDAPARVGSPRLRGRLGSRAGPGCARPVASCARRASRLCPGARRGGDHCSLCSRAPGCLCPAAPCSPSPHVFVRRPAWPEPRQAPARWGCGPGCRPGP